VNRHPRKVTIGFGTATVECRIGQVTDIPAKASPQSKEAFSVHLHVGVVHWVFPQSLLAALPSFGPIANFSYYTGSLAMSNASLGLVELRVTD
jgi:hypothetical protein